jgi:cytochrome P450
MAGTPFNPFDKSWWAAPYSVYQALLEDAPVGQVPGLGIWYFARYADCESILRDNRFGVDERKSNLYDQFMREANPQRADDEIRSFLFLDPPEHTRLRGFVARAFTPKVVDGLKSAISETVRGLLDEAERASEVDLIASLAYPLPVTVICDLLGIPAVDRDQFHQWSKHLVAGLDPELVVAPELLAERRGALTELRAYMATHIANRRRDPRDDLVSSLASISRETARDKNATMSDDELISTLVLLLVAGYETTVNLIGNALLALGEHPAQRAKLEHDPSLMPNAIEEVLRFDPPVQLTSRTALDDVHVGGVDVAKGSIVIVLLAAANRDTARFVEPTSFDVSRKDVRHLSFSFGAHHCLGAPLARSEATIALGQVLERFPDYELNGPPQYRETLVLRGIERLPALLRR